MKISRGFIDNPCGFMVFKAFHGCSMGSWRFHERCRGFQGASRFSKGFQWYSIRLQWVSNAVQRCFKEFQERSRCFKGVSGALHMASGGYRMSRSWGDPEDLRGFSDVP